MYIEQKYISQLSLEGLRPVGNNWNFRCPICGDSSLNKRKTRGWLLNKQNSYIFYCHNCSTSLSFSAFLKQINPVLYNEYVYEIFKKPEAKPKSNVFYIDSDEVVDIPFLDVCKPVLQLDLEHPAILYLQERQIPKEKYKYIYWIDSVKDVEKLDLKNEYSGKKEDKGRIVLPMFNDKSLVAIACRSIEPNPYLRYLKYTFAPGPAIFGMYDVHGKLQIDMKKRVYVTEGAIDSLFLENAIAVGNAALHKIFVSLKSVDLVLIPDNECRNKEVVSIYEKIINMKGKIVIFPKSVNGKDINKMVQNHDIQHVRDIIDKHTYQGIEAKLKLSEWKRV
jgi:hypothetical protein